ncbi:hypothetical protein C8K36_1011349 [Rhodococcus sp. OK519]|nr:hypothetical protein C8K36_1011349 [Rhodococcus sp. OK519]
MSGLVIGLFSAALWHVAVDPGVPVGRDPLRPWSLPPGPGWWPSVVLLPLAGAVIGGLVAVRADAAGWRLVRDRHPTWRPLGGLVLGLALLCGITFAAAWSVAPRPGAIAEEPQLTMIFGTDDPGVSVCSHDEVLCIANREDPAHDASAAGSSPRIEVGSPWIAFPVLTALAGLGVLGILLGAQLRLVRRSGLLS